MIINADDSNFEETLLQAKVPVLVDFWAPSCAPCRIQSVTVDEVARLYKDKILFVKVNLETARQVAKNMKIKSIPTIVVFKNLDVFDVRVGVTNHKALVQMLDRSLGISIWQKWFGKKEK